MIKKLNMSSRIAILIGLSLFTASLLSDTVTCGYATEQNYSYAELVDRLVDLQFLATPPEVGEKGGSFSSWDRGAEYNERTGKYETWWANRDGEGFMDNRGTMAEIDGPGVIWRIWSAMPEPDGNL